MKAEKIRRCIAIAAAFAAMPIAAHTNEPRAARSQEQSSKASTGNPQKGKIVFENLGCNKCHGSEGEGVSGAGQNTGVPRIASTSLALPAFIQLVRKPKGVMPPFGSDRASDSDLADVYAFLQTLKPPAKQEHTAGVNPGNGQRLFVRDGCYECHGYLGQGSTSTGGTRLGPPQIPLSAFVSYVREPTGQMPPYTAKVISDEDLAEIYNFLKSVPPPPALKSIPILNQ
ncbi:MAG TPA: c-type cytochrome [Candidatus Acidoferrales bacterium]|jgi:mono/diheme cytochrome c family protein|nr:c-type cytochrome [Candidatus Acidoferrales bacterium]